MKAEGDFLGEGDEAFEWSSWQTQLLDGVVVASCSLSILGTFFIFLSYALWKDLRTTPRFMLVCLSVADLVTACGTDRCLFIDLKKSRKQ